MVPASRNNPMTRQPNRHHAVAIIITLLLLTAPALAEQRPLPVPQTGAGCPPGYSSSPTSRMCSPGPNTRARAIPHVGAGCPAGYSSSPTSGYCLETLRR
jgi:hypothetical protein